LKKYFLLIIITLTSISIYSQVYNDSKICFSPTTFYYTSAYIEKFIEIKTIDRHNYYESGINLEIHKNNYNFNLGIGAIKDEELSGVFVKNITEVKLVDKITYDSIYYVNGLMYHYYQELLVYDSITTKVPDGSMSKYTYITTSITSKYKLPSNLYINKHIFFTTLLKVGLIYEVDRFIDTKNINDVTYKKIYSPREHKSYITYGTGLSIDYIDIIRGKRYYKKYKYKTMKPFQLSLSVMYNIQPKQFQKNYSKSYISFSPIISFNF